MCVCILHIFIGWVEIYLPVVVVPFLLEARRKCEDSPRPALFCQGTQQEAHVIKNPIQPYWCLL